MSDYWRAAYGPKSCRSQGGLTLFLVSIFRFEVRVPAGTRSYEDFSLRVFCRDPGGLIPLGRQQETAMTTIILILAAAVAVLAFWVRRLDRLVSNTAAIAALHTVILRSHENCLRKNMEAEND